MTLFLLACREPNDPRPHSGPDRDLPEHCPESPCVAELASATADEPGEGDEGGQLVVVAEEWAFVQAPGIDSFEHVAVFHLPDLAWVGTWRAPRLAAGALVAQDVTGDGELDLFVGRPYAHYEGATTTGEVQIGSVELVDRLPSGDEDLVSNAVFSFGGPRQVGVGAGIALVDVDGDGAPDLTVSGKGSCCDGKTFEPSGVWAFDLGFRGEAFEADALVHFEGDYGRWNGLLTHDLDVDGAAELWEARGTLLGHDLPLADGDWDFESRWSTGPTAR